MARSEIDEKKARLVQLIAENSLIREKDFELTSGAKSTFYFDMKPAIFHPEGANLIAELIIDALHSVTVDFIAGLEMGAVPVIACVTQKSFPARPIAGFFIRKEAKTHGTRKMLEGIGRDQILTGKHVAILEDVATTGGSILKAVDAVRTEGGLVDKAIAVVDRLEGAKENLARQGIGLIPLLTAREFDL